MIEHTVPATPNSDAMAQSAGSEPLREHPASGAGMPGQSVRRTDRCAQRDERRVGAEDEDLAAHPRGAPAEEGAECVERPAEVEGARRRARERRAGGEPERRRARERAASAPSAPRAPRRAASRPRAASARASPRADRGRAPAARRSRLAAAERRDGLARDIARRRPRVGGVRESRRPPRAGARARRSRPHRVHDLDRDRAVRAALHACRRLAVGEPARCTCRTCGRSRARRCTWGRRTGT